jgi:hypothetical protein
MGRRKKPKTYKVTIRRTEYGYYLVHAEDEDEARDNYCDGDYECNDCEEDIEEVEEYEE